MDLVSRKEVMTSLKNEYNRKAAEQGFPETFGLKLAWIEKAVNDVPTAENTGTWNIAKDEPNDTLIECSECGWELYSHKAKTNYCPSCGANMGLIGTYDET